jgi:hypothetical protein
MPTSAQYNQRPISEEERTYLESLIHEDFERCHLLDSEPCHIEHRQEQQRQHRAYDDAARPLAPGRSRARSGLTRGLRRLRSA